MASVWQRLAFSAPEKQPPKPLPLPPSDRAHHGLTAAACDRFPRNPSSDGFLCSFEHSKVCIELLDTFRVTPENLALAGGGAVPPKSGSPDPEPAVGKSVVAYVAQPLNPQMYEQ